MKGATKKLKKKSKIEPPKPFIENSYQEFSRIEEEYICFNCENDTETENDGTDTESIAGQSVNQDIEDCSDEETKKNYSFIKKKYEKKEVSILLEEEAYLSD
tara:strand:+ start:3597 stop:3902 length:306 start_codon:yes stop_codon:yes gene_type:complete